MKMETTELIKKFAGQATYQITVEGKVDPRYMKSLNNLSVMHTVTSNKTLSTLTGNMEDQEALSGVLNILFDNRYSIISVMKIE